MTVQTKIEVGGLALLREPFPAHQISKLPKETGAQAKQRRADQDAGKWPPKCNVCGGFHHQKAVHLDYVGHAALTDRLLDTDPEWSWEPLSLDERGLPALDQNGGLWIRLTVLGVTRLGYGHAGDKRGGDAVKEIIGDALRNAAMRFGAALDLWHKGDLHAEEGGEGDSAGEQGEPPATISDSEWAKAVQLVEATNTTVSVMFKALGINATDLQALNRPQFDTVIDALERKLAKMAKAETNAKAREDA